jgi:hypothetical protein
VPLAQSGDAVRARATRMLLRPHAEPGLVDEPDGDSAGPFAFVRPEPEMPRGSASQARKRSCELQQALELRTLLRRAVAVVVAVLLATGRVDARCLETRARGLGEIQTSVQAGGMTSAAIRSSCSASVIFAPREST